MTVALPVLNRFACLFALWAIVLNAALGFAGPMVFCEHEAGDSHLLSPGQHSGEGNEASCHDHSMFGQPSTAEEENCESCTDTEIGGDEMQDLLRVPSQDRVSAPQVVTVEFYGFDLAELFDSGTAVLLPAKSSPPVSESMTALQVKRTVLRI